MLSVVEMWWKMVSSSRSFLFYFHPNMDSYMDSKDDFLFDAVAARLEYLSRPYVEFTVRSRQLEVCEIGKKPPI